MNADCTIAQLELLCTLHTARRTKALTQPHGIGLGGNVNVNCVSGMQTPTGGTRRTSALAQETWVWVEMEVEVRKKMLIADAK